MISHVVYFAANVLDLCALCTFMCCARHAFLKLFLQLVTDLFITKNELGVARELRVPHAYNFMYHSQDAEHLFCVSTAIEHLGVCVCQQQNETERS